MNIIISCREGNLYLHYYVQIGDFGMARDLMDETYYTAKSKDARIPVKWTAPEVAMWIVLEIFLEACINCSSHLFRHFIIRNTPLTVMCGAMVWCCLRYGQSGRSHSHSFQILSSYETLTQATTSPLPLDAQEPSTNSWLTAGMYFNPQAL